MTTPESFLQKVSLFEKCTPVDLQRMALSLHWHSHKQGETILFQGMISHQMFFVIAGKVGVYSRQGRDTRRVATLEAGSYFGEISLLTSKAATATIKAEVDDTQIYLLDREAVTEILSRNPAAMADVAQKVRERNQSRAEAFQKTEEPVAVPVA